LARGCAQFPAAQVTERTTLSGGGSLAGASAASAYNRGKGGGRIKPVIDSTFPPEQAAAAHARMETSQHIGKIVLTV
jgi:NADPH:quinone reductase-like Zn-dependent oxidoreductase